ncbi:NADP-dependent 3-hydroxy acid dehydrogenase YdfG [Pelomonas aquatica]|uniref:NADP-dependent 3-hydroxy acid dehydrogenase YdfG n=2 Tax=Pelomonas aquatica TaxID=431058 RepID=A0ABU1ZEM1_9BURK|nr:NADP-dependent 3-hydroxy acid dehydrogenase YdfG [Pelomonas aquatica]
MARSLSILKTAGFEWPNHNVIYRRSASQNNASIRFPKELDMKVLLIGASGVVGSAVLAELARRHEVLTAGREHGEYRVDITRDDSVEALFKAVGAVDAIVSTAGSLFFGPLETMRPADFNIGLQNKLLGQVRLALLGQHALRDGGSITLTTGIVADEPIRQGANATAVNSAVEGFVRAAAIELPRGARINAVNPTLLTESVGVYGAVFPGFETVPAARVALAYVRSVEGAQTGRVYRVWQ